MSRRGRIELGECRHPVLGELPRLQAANRGDECAVRYALRPLADDVLHLGDRERGLDRARLVTGAAADQLHVEVVVDHPGDDRAAAEIDACRCNRPPRSRHRPLQRSGRSRCAPSTRRCASHPSCESSHWSGAAAVRQDTAAPTRAAGISSGWQQRDRRCRHNERHFLYHRLSIGLSGSAVMFSIAQWW